MNWFIHWLNTGMAESEAVVSSEHVLDWVKQDKRRFLHAVYRVGDLERTIKYVFDWIFLHCLLLISRAFKLLDASWVDSLFLTLQDFIPSALGWNCWGKEMSQKRSIQMHSLALDLKILILQLSWHIVCSQNFVLLPSHFFLSLSLSFCFVVLWLETGGRHLNEFHGVNIYVHNYISC